MSELIISVSGLRGIVGETLTDEVAARYVAAFAAGLEQGTLVISSDGRASGASFRKTISAALADAGHDVLDAGVASTPTLGVLVRQHGAIGGVQVSASHNPAQYNGLKLMDSAGKVLSADAGGQVLARYQQGLPKPTAAERGTIKPLDDSVSEHLRLVLATVGVEQIRAAQFNVLLDANHGSGAILGRALLEALGCRVQIAGEEPTGQFLHEPEPIAENLSEVGRQVVSLSADVCFCQDPDADRLAVIDQTGRYLGEEFTLALCLNHVLPQRPGAVVTNCATSLMTQRVAERHGATLVRTAVGEANVVEAMIARQAAFGGEGNGGPIDPRVGYIRDSFVGMALVLAAMAARKMTIAALADELPRYEIVKTKLTLDREKIPAALDAVERHFAESQPDRLDGLRLDWPDKWLLVRGSNTEPIVRVIAEAASRAEALALCDEAASAIAHL